MSLPGCCPGCGLSGDIEVFLLEGDLAQTDRISLAMPEGLATEIEQYVRLFAKPGKRVTTRRRRSLLADLLPHLQAGKLQFDGRVWPAPLAYWREAITQMVEGRDKLSLPLPNNNYLYRVVSGLSQKADAAAERTHDTKARGVTPVATSAAHKAFQPEAPAPKRNPQAAAEALAKAKNLLTKGA